MTKAAIAPAISAGTAIGGAVKGGGGGGGGQTVNPMQLAQAQGAANINTSEAQAALQNININSPYGATWYQPTSWDSSTGRPSSYALNQNLSSPLANLFGGQTSLASNLTGGIAPYLSTAGNLANMAGAPLSAAATMAGGIPANLDLSAVPNIGMLSPSSFRTNVTGGAGGQPIPGAVTSLPLQTSVNSNFPQLVKQAQDAAYGSQTQYLDPQFQQQEESLRQSMADQGIEEGSPAFSRAMGDFTRQKQMAYQGAQDQAVAAGNQQEQSLFGQSLAGGQFTNQALLAGGGFTNQAQGQLFGQGMSLADLYNQAQLGAAGQNVQAQEANLQRAQQQAAWPITAAQGELGVGTGLFGTGQNVFPTAAGMVNLAPEWPLAIPTAGPMGVSATAPNLGAAVQGATYANTLANQVQGQNLQRITDLTRTLTGQGGLFGQGGPFANMFSGGGGSDTWGFDPSGYGWSGTGAGGAQDFISYPQ